MSRCNANFPGLVKCAGEAGSRSPTTVLLGRKQTHQPGRAYSPPP
jgi:hypothetical protein